MELFIKDFDSLDIYELHDILQLRSEVFVVEQDCVYQDIDGKDHKALHVYGKQDGKIVTYTRCFPPGYYFDQAAIGRVVVHPDYRKNDLGKKIMRASIEAIEDTYQTSNITLSAQTYLGRFYSDLGFQAVGEEYLEDGIPHVKMIKKTP